MLPEAKTIFGTTNEILTEANLEALYGIPVHRAQFGDGERRDAAFVPRFRQRNRLGDRP
jgi:iron complex transport system ATP-binding protein